jgi:hypothetical protein
MTAILHRGFPKIYPDVHKADRAHVIPVDAVGHPGMCNMPAIRFTIFLDGRTSHCASVWAYPEGNDFSGALFTEAR